MTRIRDIVHLELETRVTISHHAHIPCDCCKTSGIIVNFPSNPHVDTLEVANLSVLAEKTLEEAGWQVVGNDHPANKYCHGDDFSVVCVSCFEDPEGTCPNCQQKGLNNEGCPECPGFWYTNDPDVMTTDEYLKQMAE